MLGISSINVLLASSTAQLGISLGVDSLSVFLEVFLIRGCKVIFLAQVPRLFLFWYITCLHTDIEMVAFISLVILNYHGEFIRLA